MRYMETCVLHSVLVSLEEAKIHRVKLSKKRQEYWWCFWAQNEAISAGFWWLQCRIGISCWLSLQNFLENGHLPCVITSSMEKGCIEVLKKNAIMSYNLWHILPMQSYNLKKIVMELILRSSLFHLKMSRDKILWCNFTYKLKNQDDN